MTTTEKLEEIKTRRMEINARKVQIGRAMQRGEATDEMRAEAQVLKAEYAELGAAQNALVSE